MDSQGPHPSYSSSQEGYEEPHGRPYSLSMEGIPGMCHVASSFYEVLQESGLQEQLVNGWGHAYSDRSATASSSPPASDAYDGSHPSRRSQPRTGQKSSSPSPSSSRRSAQRRDGQSSRRSKSSDRHKKFRASNIKEEHEEDEHDERDTRSLPRKGTQTPDSKGMGQSYGYSFSGEDFGGRDCSGGFSTELNTLRMHLLRLANGTQQIPRPPSHHDSPQ